MFASRENVEAVGPIGYGADLIDLLRRFAIHIERILKDTNSADHLSSKPPKDASTKRTIRLCYLTAIDVGSEKPTDPEKTDDITLRRSH